MSDGAFRDGSAALERAAALQERNAELEAELLELRGVASEAERELEGDTLTSLRAELKSTLSKLHAATRDLQTVQENYRALRNGRFENADEVSVEKARADGLEKQLEGLADLRRKESALKSGLESALRANARIRDDVDKNALELEKLQRLLLEPPPRREAQPAPAKPDVPENYQAFVTRLEEERQELLVEVKELREKLAAKVEPSLLGSLLGRR